jgi:Ras family protein T1
LVKEIEKASVICLVYAVNDQNSKEKLCTYWLPKIQEIEDSLSVAAAASTTVSFAASASSFTPAPLSPTLLPAEAQKRPIVLVANKSDTQNEMNLTQDPLITSLILSHTQIETCVKCSAKTLKNVPEVFYYAQKSVLYPTAPCYDVDRKRLTTEAVKGLTRIFKLCDHDNDCLLNDKELNEFQLKCFGVSLNAVSLQEVKTLLNTNNNNINERNDHLLNNQITLNGFLFLHTLFFRKGRQETSWTVLKKFGYDKNLTLSRDYLNIKYLAKDYTGFCLNFCLPGLWFLNISINFTHFFKAFFKIFL